MKEMTCREFDELVHGFVRMELLDVTMREAALEHASGCELCSERLANAAALVEVTETMGALSRDSEAPPRVEAFLLAAFRNHHRRATWRRTFEWAVVGAVAAVLLIFFWTSARRPSVPSSTAPSKDGTSQSGAPLDAMSAAPANPIAAAPVAQTVVAEAPAGGTYATSDFVPVPFTGAISPDDPGMVVRVQLTRSSLAQLGYPVAETPDEGLVLADVLVGEDGWPRGVKVIQ